MGKLNEQLVTAVIVTYGDRKAFLSQGIDALRKLGLLRVVVVDNGAAWPVKRELSQRYSELVDVVELGKNTGSAMGFSVGIRRALELGAEYVWLLDDDNRPRVDTLRQLIAAYSYALKAVLRDRLAVVAFRPEHEADLVMGVSVHRVRPRANSFCGFHVLDIPYKLWQRTSWGKPKIREKAPTTVLLRLVPYSGLLFHRDLIESIGLPNPDFVLYVDDSEFTYRITRLGGQIVLVTDAILDDLEVSWNIKARFGNSFSRMLRGLGDPRAYYGMRNGTYFNTLNSKEDSFVFWLNRSVYMILLFLFALALGRLGRYRLLREAVQDGLKGRLGINQRFPL